MGNCCVKCKNTNKKIKKKAKQKQTNVRHHQYKTRRGGDNGDILNHIEALLQTNEVVIDVDHVRKPDSLLTHQQHEQPSPTHVQVFDYDNDYKSLKKSKKSIKILEETIKNSYSIENWLNNIDKIDEQHPPKPEKTCTEQPTNELLTKLLNIKSKSAIKYLQALFQVNNVSTIKQIEVEFREYFNAFLLPRSQSYTEDIDLLKWFFQNYNLSLYLPVAYTTHKTTATRHLDNYKCVNEHFYTFLLSSNDFNIKLCDLIGEQECDTPLQSSQRLLQSQQTPATPKSVLDLQDQHTQQQQNHDLEFEYFKNLYDLQAKICGRLRIIKRQNKKLNKKQLSLLSSSSLHNKQQQQQFSANRNILKNKRNLNGSIEILDTNNNHNEDEGDENFYYLSYDELNQRLQSCLLGNFTRNLTEQFLKNLKDVSKSQQNFIQKSIKNGFTYVTANKTEQNELNINYFKFKFCIKLNEWPFNYEQAFFKRERQHNWPCDETLEQISNNCCALINDSNEASQTQDIYWTIDYSYAQLELFISLNDEKKFLYFLILNCFKEFFTDYYTCQTMQQKCDLNEELEQLEKILLNAYFIYLESNYKQIEFSLQENFIKIIKKFVKFLQNLYVTNQMDLNAQNFFDFKLKILNNYKSQTVLNENFMDLIEKFLKKLDFLLKINQNNIKQSDVSLYLNENCKILDDLTCKNVRKCSNLAGVYEYLYEFSIKFEEFYNLKRENFRINEEILIEMHLNSVKTYDKLVKLDLNCIDKDVLLENFEKYAQIVHVYLPQIRSKHQLLLFHYIWTMHIQYLIPFFNYIIDLYLNNLNETKTSINITNELLKTITPPLSISSKTTSKSSILSSTSSLLSSIQSANSINHQKLLNGH